jgi:hypothetical protein
VTPQAPAGFFLTWWGRFRAFAMIAGAWGFLFSVNSLIGFQAGFEYDDGLVYSTPAFKAAEKDKLETGTPDYWNSVNRSFSYEHLKPVPWLTAWTLRVLGVKVAVFLDRGEEGADSLEASWRTLADHFYFVRTEDEKYKILEKKRFILYAAPSDTGIIQARKADVTPLRIRKSPKSVNPLESTPGKFGEFTLPLSGF